MDLSGKTLITGGAGFIGSHLAERLRSRGDEVLLIDDLSTGNEANVAHLLGQSDEAGCTLIQGKVSDVLEAQPGLIADVKTIYHLAASVGVQLVKENPAATIQNNVTETGAILDAAQRANATVLIASSSEVYGKSNAIPLREDGDLVYGPTTGPRWSYALSKAFDEHLALSYHKQVKDHGGAAVVARLFNTIGSRQVGHYGMVVPRFVAAALSGEPLQVYGDGQQTRAFCDVRDVVTALIALVENEHCHGEVFNVGSDDEITIDALADRVIALSGSSSTKQRIAFDEAYEPGFEDPFRRRVPDVTKVREAIGFEREYALEDTLRELINV